MLIAHCRCPSREPCCTSTLLLVTMSLFSGVPWDPSHPLCPPTHALGPLRWVPSQGLSLGTPRSVGNRDLFPALCSAGHHGLTAVGLSGAPQGSWSPGIPGPALEGGRAESLQQRHPCCRPGPSQAVSLAGQGCNRTPTFSIMAKSGRGRFSSTGKYPGEQLTAEQFLKGFEKQAAS